MTSTALSAAVADCDVVHVAASGSTTVVVVESTVTLSALAFTVKRSKTHPTPPRTEARISLPTWRQSTGGNAARMPWPRAFPALPSGGPRWTNTLRFATSNEKETSRAVGFEDRSGARHVILCYGLRWCS